MAQSGEESTATVELEFEIRDESCFFVHASRLARCTLRGQLALQRTDGTSLEYFAVEDADPKEVCDLARDLQTIESARLVGGADRVIEVVIEGPCIAATLADEVAVITEAVAENGVANVLADVPIHADVEAVCETVFDNHPHSELIAKRHQSRSPAVGTVRSVDAILGHLTEKQRNALQTAMVLGYFSWPRECTATDCADALGISQPTFSQHLRRAEETLFAELFRTA